MSEEELYKAQKLIEVRICIRKYESALADTESPLYWPEFSKMKEAFELVLKSLYDVQKALSS